MRGLRYQPGDVVNFDNSTDSPFGNPTRVEVGRHATRGALQQVSTAEQATTAAQVVNRYRLFLPPDETIDAGDEWQMDGNRYFVDGAPIYARAAPGGNVHHIEALVRFVGPVA